MDTTDLLIGVLIVVGIVGIVVPVLPGSILVLGAILLWATEEGTRTGWIVFAIATVLLVLGGIVKYAVPGRSLKASGVPTRSIMLGGLLGFVGFFVIPVVGLFIGFVAGIYLAELHRVGREQAWPSTRFALRAVGASILIELVAALLAASVWYAGVVLA